MHFCRGFTRIPTRGFATHAKNYYKILSVDPKAPLLDIKKRYNALAKEYHPDINPAQANYFKEINEAYGVLSKADERKKYDDMFMGGVQSPHTAKSEPNNTQYDNVYNSVS